MSGLLTCTDFSICYVRPEAPQLFFLFMGVWEPLTIHVLDFLRGTAIGERNIVIVKDPYRGQCYHRGISDEYDSLDGIARWQQDEIVSRFPHVREVFCVGGSAGGGPAIHTACRLRARAAWSFGGRIATPEVLQERERVSAAFYQKTIGRPALQCVTADEHAKLVEAFSHPDVHRLRWNLTGNPETVVARGRVDALVSLVRAESTSTDYHFYYATTNVIDRGFAEAFRGLPRVTLHPVTPPPTDWTQDVIFRDPDHAILPMLHQAGQLDALFSAYL